MIRAVAGILSFVSLDVKQKYTNPSHESIKCANVQRNPYLLPLNTQNEWIILTLIRAVAGFCLLFLDMKQKYRNPSDESIKCENVQRNPYFYSWHEANISGLQVRN